MEVSVSMHIHKEMHIDELNICILVAGLLQCLQTVYSVCLRNRTLFPIINFCKNINKFWERNSVFVILVMNARCCTVLLFLFLCKYATVEVCVYFYYLTKITTIYMKIIQPTETEVRQLAVVCTLSTTRSVRFPFCTNIFNWKISGQCYC